MADDDKLWDIRLKGLNYLLIAHAAGLVGCLTVLNNYDTNPHLKGLASSSGCSGSGLYLLS